MKIKICGLKNVNNLRQILELSPDYVGFNFYQSSKRFCSWPELPDLDFGKTETVGVFVNATLEYITEKVSTFRLSAVQLHGSESVAEVQSIKTNLPACRVIKVFGIEDRTDLQTLTDFEQVSDFYLFDKKSASFGGTGKKFDWDLLSENEIKKDFFLAGGIGPLDVRALKILRAVLPRFMAIDINSCFEDSEGIKQVGMVSEFMGQLR